MDYHKIKRIILFIFEAWFRQVLKNPTPLGCVNHFRIFDYTSIHLLKEGNKFKVDGYGLWVMSKPGQSMGAQVGGQNDWKKTVVYRVLVNRSERSWWLKVGGQVAETRINLTVLKFKLRWYFHKSGRSSSISYNRSLWTSLRI